MTETKKPTEIKGRFKKGVSGNLNGRPSNKKLAEKTAEKMAEILEKEFGENVDYVESESQSFLKQSLAFFKARLETAKSPEEQERFIRLGTETANKLMPYQEARLSSKDLDNNKIDEIIIKFQEPDPINEDHPMVKKIIKEILAKKCEQK